MKSTKCMITENLTKLMFNKYLILSNDNNQEFN